MEAKGVKPTEHQYGTEALISISKIVAQHLTRATKCCPNCEHFDGQFELCKLANKKPPATIIAFGCEVFVNNDLPF